MLRQGLTIERHAEDGKRSEMAAVLFQYNVMGTRGPRKMKAMMPALSESGGQEKLLTSSKGSSAILEWCARYHLHACAHACCDP